MATSLGRTVDRTMLARTGALVGVCTAALTAAFVGSLIVLEESRHRGKTVILGAVGTGIAGLVLVGLGTEGVVYATSAPGTVLSSSLLVYLVAAALIASGLGYWSVRNWRLLGRRLPDGRL